jgi:hypothetical protein
MAFPTVESVTPTSFASASTTHNVAMPATVNAGDLLVILFTTGGGTSVTNPSGWTEEYNAAIDTVSNAFCTAKLAAGDEGGTTVNLATADSVRGAAQVYRISGWFGTLATGLDSAIAAAAFGSTPNPPSLNPSEWDEEDTLYMAVAHLGAFGRTISAYPTNYTDGTFTSDGAGVCGTGSARRELAAASDDPGAFTLSSFDWARAATIAIRPAAPPPAEPELTNPTATATGATTADLAVTTDTDNGTLYAVVTTSDTAPSAAQVKAGQDHTGAAAAFDDSQAISSTGEKEFNATGLSAGTLYYAHFMHEDDSANQSDVASSTAFRTYYELAAETAVFALTANDATLDAGYALPANTGTFVLMGASTAFRNDYVLPAAAASFAVSAQDATLLRGYPFPADTGAFTLTANDTSLIADYGLAAETGEFALTGEDTALDRGFILPADTAAFAVSGEDATLLTQRVITAGTGAFTLTGGSLNLDRGYQFQADAAEFAVSGEDATVRAQYAFPAGTGAFTLTGISSTLAYSGDAGDGDGLAGLSALTGLSGLSAIMGGG